MPDVYTGTSALSNLVAGAVDQYVRAALRHQPLLRNIADTRPAQVDKPGSSVTFYKHGKLADATTPLNELTDPDVVALPNPTPVQVTLNEYGNAAITSIKVKNFSFSQIDPHQLTSITNNMRDSLDALVGTALYAGTNKFRGGATTRTNTTDILAADTIVSRNVRHAVTKLRSAAVEPVAGELYNAYIHPDVAADLREESGSNGWREAHVNAAPGLIWPGVTGVYEGAQFIESARMKVAVKGGGKTGGTGDEADVYTTLFHGREALAEAVQIEPHVEIGVVPDKLNRFFPLGWYGLLGWAIFRNESLILRETSSSFV